MKYFNKKIVVDGIKYDSKAEYRRYLELNNNPKITHLENQKKFVLLETFKDNQGKTERGISYKCDFFYLEGDSYVVEDVKCKYTSKLNDYIIKRKLFKTRYPQYIFREIIIW